MAFLRRVCWDLQCCAWPWSCSVCCGRSTTRASQLAGCAIFKLRSGLAAAAATLVVLPCPAVHRPAWHLKLLAAVVLPRSWFRCEDPGPYDKDMNPKGERSVHLLTAWVVAECILLLGAAPNISCGGGSSGGSGSGSSSLLRFTPVSRLAIPAVRNVTEQLRPAASLRCCTAGCTNRPAPTPKGAVLLSFFHCRLQVPQARRLLAQDHVWVRTAFVQHAQHASLSARMMPSMQLTCCGLSCENHLSCWASAWAAGAAIECLPLLTCHWLCSLHQASLPR